VSTLSRDLRRALENTVRQARRTAETGARKVIEQLAVHHHEPWPGMTPSQRELRNRLRAHGRQLGDRHDDRRGVQGIDRLTTECAYEDWHRMLFARYLAECELLIEPQSGVAISLAECEELARAEGRDWLELAAEYAQRMLPQIFRSGDPVLEVALPPETRSALEDLMKALPRDVFVADDSLGWVYQYWQADRKEEVNRSEKKIGADELPAVTQLFTEDYMVLFLLHNTLGAWWAGKVLAAKPALAESASNEGELRAACAVGDVEWTYLRFVREDGKPWRPAAGTFEGWPKAAKHITLLDPCMGSGHFLVFALPMLAAMLVLVYLQTGFESYIKSIGLFLLLLSVPEIVTNTLWYHPEGLVLLLIGLTFLFLVRDDLKFGRNFYLAALFCGLAVATKLVGLFFFLAIPYYIFLGWRHNRIDTRKAIVVAAQFVTIMFCTFVLVNPFLFWESERKFAWKTQSDLHDAMGAGFIVEYTSGPLDWYNLVVKKFSIPAFLLLSAVSVVIGALKGPRRLLNQLIIIWAVPFAIYILVALAIHPGHFPVPILLPVFSSLPAYFTFFTPPKLTGSFLDYLKRHALRLVMLVVGITIVAAQFSFSLSRDIPHYLSVLNREQNSRSLQFYEKINNDYLLHITLARPLIVFRDVGMYIPDSPKYEMHFKWGISNYNTIQKFNSEMLVLSKQHLYDYTQEGMLEKGRDPDFVLTYDFYKDALEGTVDGFTLLYQDDFGVVYLSTPLYVNYFSSP